MGAGNASSLGIAAGAAGVAVPGEAPGWMGNSEYAGSAAGGCKRSDVGAISYVGPLDDDKGDWLCAVAAKIIVASSITIAV